jgi:hypothetical protein
MKTKLRLVPSDETHIVYGSKSFIFRTRRPDLPSPKRFEPTRKEIGDVGI